MGTPRISVRGSKMDTRRLKRIGGLIEGYVATLLLTKAKDPRLKNVTITRAEITPDLKKARVFYSVLGGDEEKIAAETALKKAKGFVRASVGENLELRNTPEIVFIFDKNPGYAQKVEEILEVEKKRLSAADEENLQNSQESQNSQDPQASPSSPEPGSMLPESQKDHPSGEGALV
jgi:ribosome-binding factor A